MRQAVSTKCAVCIPKLARLVKVITSQDHYMMMDKKYLLETFTIVQGLSEARYWLIANISQEYISQKPNRA
jgi:hypothetical protein